MTRSEPCGRGDSFTTPSTPWEFDGRERRARGCCRSRRPLIGTVQNKLGSAVCCWALILRGRGDRPGWMRGYGRRCPSGARGVAAQQRGAGARSGEVPCRSDVYVAFSQDETEIGFAFPKEERAALVAARTDVFFLP